MNIRKVIVDNIPIEDTTPAITVSVKLFVVTDGTGVSLGGDGPPEGIHVYITHVNMYRYTYTTHLATQAFVLVNSEIPLMDYKSLLELVLHLKTYHGGSNSVAIFITLKLHVKHFVIQRTHICMTIPGLKPEVSSIAPDLLTRIVI